MLSLDSKSLSSDIVIDRMEAWSSKSLKPRKRHFEGRYHRKRIIGLVEICLGREQYMNNSIYIKSEGGTK
jgi:hypothetical protein